MKMSLIPLEERAGRRKWIPARMIAASRKRAMKTTRKIRLLGDGVSF
jgi:hypothetical protein